MPATSSDFLRKAVRFFLNFYFPIRCASSPGKKKLRCSRRGTEQSNIYLRKQIRRSKPQGKTFVISPEQIEIRVCIFYLRCIMRNIKNKQKTAAAAATTTNRTRGGSFYSSRISVISVKSFNFNRLHLGFSIFSYGRNNRYVRLFEI